MKPLKILVFSLLLWSVAWQAIAADLAPVVEQTLDVHGITREFLVVGARNAKPSPLVIVFHGGSRNAKESMERDSFGAWNTLASEKKILVLFPQGKPHTRRKNKRSWNDCRADLSPTDKGFSDWDDVAFFDAMVDWAVAERNADPQRVYASGASNGGMMVYRLMQERPDKLTAAAVQIANQPANNECTQPLTTLPPLMLTTGTLDKLMPEQGGCVAFDCTKGRVLSVDKTIELWRLWLGATQADPSVNLPDYDKNDNSTITRHVYRDREGCTKLVHDVAVGGGHSTPGGPQFGPLVRNQLGLGWRNRDISYVQEALKFFEAVPPRK